jgi:type II secretory pathway component PulM
MAALVVLLVLAALVYVVFHLGFHLGYDQWQAELTRVRLEAAHAQRAVHDLTKTAFVAMAEQAEHHRNRP